MDRMMVSCKDQGDAFESTNTIRCAVARCCRRSFSAARGVGSRRFAQFRELCHRPPEGARGHDAFGVRNIALETGTRHAVQFERRAHGDDAKAFADQPRISALEIERRLKAD